MCVCVTESVKPGTNDLINEKFRIPTRAVQWSPGYTYIPLNKLADAINEQTLHNLRIPAMDQSDSSACPYQDVVVSLACHRRRFQIVHRISHNDVRVFGKRWSTLQDLLIVYRVVLRCVI